MNLHEILTGAVNAGDHCYSTGSVEGVPFTAYGAGCNVVVLASDFTRVQIIPGILQGNVQVTCLDCSTDVGKIAVAYGKKVCIFEPTPLLSGNSGHKLDYKWIETAALQVDSNIGVLSWNLEGTKLLIGGTMIQMWHLLPDVDTENHINEEVPSKNAAEPEHEFDTCKLRWDCVWRCCTATPVTYLRFSPDGSLFVSAGKNDRLVKIWYESPAKISYTGGGHTAQTNHPMSEVSYTFIYIAHPRAITGISWRKTSKYIPRGCNANMLVTSCRDNICRIWVQTLLPDDGLINFNQIEGLDKHTVPRVQTQRHRQKFMQRMKHMKSFKQFKSRQAAKNDGALDNEPIPNLPSTFSVHDFHTFGVHGTAITPGFHFHLAASINAETDIPLVPSMDEGITDVKERPRFVMHWLNNKEMVFTQAAEKLLQELSTKVMKAERAASVHSDNSGEESEGEEHETNSTHTVGSKSRPPLDMRKNLANKIRDEDREELESHISRQSIHTVPSSASIMAPSETGSGHANPPAEAHPALKQNPLSDWLDRMFEALLRDWHSSSDVLFSIHPVDGSLLVWLVEYLDETIPGSFRQAQVSFSSRIPSAIPLGDSATMSHHVALYSPASFFDLKTLTSRSSTNTNFEAANGHASTLPNNNRDTDEELDEEEEEQDEDGEKKPPKERPRAQSLAPEKPPKPTVYMISKHNNGTINQWSLTFGEHSSFTQILSVAHTKRVSGHRFRVNDIACHPVLPLLLTTSHHNRPGGSLPPGSPSSSVSSHVPSTPSPSIEQPAVDNEHTGFCSELILWKVDPVGPSAKTGGITELARINSPELSAFANVAWIPTLLPSTTLGSFNSPSACFIASDGHQLRVYQAVIDARTLLAEIKKQNKVGTINNMQASYLSDDSDDLNKKDKNSSSLAAIFKIVSLQSTSRPGCILELTAINDAIHDWQNTQLLHVFQDQLIKGDKVSLDAWAQKQDPDSPSLVEPGLGAVVDLRDSQVFEEPFYLVVLEKNSTPSQSTIHMWKLVVSSENVDKNEINLTNEEESIRNGSFEIPDEKRISPLKITTAKVCTQNLNLPDDVELIHATPAAGHLSSSNIYPACFAPYLLCTAGSGGFVRFWRCNVQQAENEPDSFEWVEWEMMLNKGSSAIEVPGLPLYVSCAYSGRIACAYKHGQSFTKPTSPNPTARYININLAIYECESTGGSEWILEDTIKLKNVAIPQSELTLGIDIEPLIDTTLKNKRTADTLLMRLTSNTNDDHESRTTNIRRLLSVPSYTTMHSLKKIISEQGNQFTLAQKSIVQLDWVSTEDGSHILTVSVGSKTSMFTPVSTDIAQANLKEMKTSKAATATSHRTLLKQASSMAIPMTQPDDIRWMALRTTNLRTADGLPPLPMKLSWVREGILVVGMDNEMHIYTQWKSEQKEAATERDIEQVQDVRMLTEKGLLSHAQESSQLRLPTHPGLNSRSPSSHALSASSHSIDKLKSSTAKELEKAHINKGEEEGDKVELDEHHLPDFGIFEASRLACPVLPQYHPKQLSELLAYGKIRRVRAILSHLVAVLSEQEKLKGLVDNAHQVRNSDSESPRPSYQRSMSVAGGPGSPPPIEGLDCLSPSAMEKEERLDYTEITSIKPLPLFTLVEAEVEKPVLEKTNSIAKTRPDSVLDSEHEYGGLFDTGNLNSRKSQVEETLDEILNRSGFDFQAQKREPAKKPLNLQRFEPSQARTLTKMLTHSHLPGLSSLDQMHLLALADAVASFNASSDTSKSGDDAVFDEPGHDDHHGVDQGVTIDALDACGLKFLSSKRQHTYLLRCLPIAQRRQLHKDGLSTSSIVWAFHSETQDELVQLINLSQRGKLKWSTLRELGVGWWVRNNITLKRLMEQVAKCAFQAKSDPLDAALLYLAMKKKSLVWGLYRSVQDKKMTDFFQNNFAEDKWRRSALKNAYALLGKQRFEHAAAFFLLAGNVWDAVEMCISKLDDIQLAIVIIRLYEGEQVDTVSSNMKRLLYQEILGSDAKGENHQPSTAHPDPFLRSMAYWIVQDYSSALTTLLDSDIGCDHHKAPAPDKADETWVPPSVFNFYLYLRTHPLIIKRHLAQTLPDKKDSKGEQLTAEAITPFERRLFFKTAYQHFRTGCPNLALEVLSRLPNQIAAENASLIARRDTLTQLPSEIISTGHFEDVGPKKTEKADEVDWGAPVAAKQDSSSDFDWGAPVVAQKSAEEEFDWGAPTSFGKIDTEFKIDIKIDSGSDSEGDDGLQMPPKPPTSPKPPENRKIKIDIMAQQLKFIACLKIIMEELSTLSSGFEKDNDNQLRAYLYAWLEKTVIALKNICSYRGLGDKFPQSSLESRTPMLMGTLSPADRVTPRDSHSDSGEPTAPPTEKRAIIQEPAMSIEQTEFEQQLAAKRKEWLIANEALLRTLLSYCSLHGSHGGSLASVRAELTLLIDELLDEKGQLEQKHQPIPVEPQQDVGDSLEPEQHNSDEFVMRRTSGMLRKYDAEVIHTDSENISSFCLSKAKHGQLALSTPKMILELDTASFLQNVDLVLPVGQKNVPKMVMKRNSEGVKRLSSHPTRPLYVSGHQDGSVNLWEWSYNHAISTPRAAGAFSKVSQTKFSYQGNKFGVTDGDGNLSLWQVSMTLQGATPYFSMKVHDKTACDFAFLCSSSVVVTAGQSHDHRNVCMWDTLLPEKRALVTSFACHEQHGASAIIFAPLNQLLLTGGKKGDVFVFDMRQRTQRHKFQAHESAVKCMALDPGEEFFATGSADGDIKAWSLGAVHVLLHSFPGEHTRSTMFRNIGLGVSRLLIDSSGRLFSCGAGGSMKVRQLPDKSSNNIVNTI